MKPFCAPRTAIPSVIRLLADFLAALPSYQRKWFEQGFSSLTADEQSEWSNDVIAGKPEPRGEYERLVSRIPAKLRKYRQREADESARVRLMGIPANPPGRPRKDFLRAEVEHLRESGLSYPRVSMRINREHGEGTTTPESVRALSKSRRLKARKTTPPPDKT
jgi:hypothetical protein